MTSPSVPSRDLGARIGVAIVGAIVVFVGPQIFPGLFAFGGWVACPRGTADPVIMTWTGGSAKGGTSYHWDLYCMQSDGFAVHPGVFGAWAATTSVLVLVLAIVLVLMTILARRAG